MALIGTTRPYSRPRRPNQKSPEDSQLGKPHSVRGYDAPNRVDLSGAPLLGLIPHDGVVHTCRFFRQAAEEWVVQGLGVSINYDEEF